MNKKCRLNEPYPPPEGCSFYFLTLILIVIVLLAGCNKEAEYTKGFPFWIYDWDQGELMAEYNGFGGGYKWEYYRYAFIPDTIVNLDTGKKYSAPFQV